MRLLRPDSSCHHHWRWTGRAVTAVRQRLVAALAEMERQKRSERRLSSIDLSRLTDAELDELQEIIERNEPRMHAEGDAFVFSTEDQRALDRIQSHCFLEEFISTRHNSLL
jgi:hypothetical protein